MPRRREHDHPPGAGEPRQRQLRVGEELRHALAQMLRPGEMRDPALHDAQITVTEAPPELQTETAEVDSEINQTQISELPITSSKGRNYEELYTGIPGAAQVQEKNSIGGNPSRAMAVRD